jgi:hypothetical protein
MNVLRLVEGRVFRKATASSNGGGCVGLPQDGRRDAVVDFKSNQVLSVSCAGLVTYAKESVRWT